MSLVAHIRMYIPLVRHRHRVGSWRCGARVRPAACAAAAAAAATAAGAAAVRVPPLEPQGQRVLAGQVRAWRRQGPDAGGGMGRPAPRRARDPVAARRRAPGSACAGAIGACPAAVAASTPSRRRHPTCRGRRGRAPGRSWGVGGRRWPLCVGVVVCTDPVRHSPSGCSPRILSAIGRSGAAGRRPLRPQSSHPSRMDAVRTCR